MLLAGVLHACGAACYSQEFCTRAVQMVFARPQRRVQVRVGYNGRLSDPVEVRLVAFDGDGNVIDGVAAALGPSQERVPIGAPLEVTDAGNRLGAPSRARP